MHQTDLGALGEAGAVGVAVGAGAAVAGAATAGDADDSADLGSAEGDEGFSASALFAGPALLPPRKSVTYQPEPLS